MNKVYKLVWSKVKNAYVVASELAKSHAKAPKSEVMSKSFVAGVLACVLSCGAVMPVMAAGYMAGDAIQSGDNSVAIGKYAYANAATPRTVVIGYGAGDYVNDSVVIGSLAVSDFSVRSLALGNHATIYDADDSIAIGANSFVNTKNIVSFGHKTGDYYFDLKNGNKVDVEDRYEKKYYTSDLFRVLRNVGNGQSAHDAATVAQTSTTAAGAGITVSSATNTNGSTKYTVAVNANGTVTSGNANPLKGGTVYTEVRPSANGTFVKTANTTATNLTALDTAAKNAIKGLSVSGKTITYTKGDGTTGTITTQDTNTTYSAFKGATADAAGAAGLVVAPAKGKQGAFLRGDGTWATPTDNNTTYTAGTGLTLSGTAFSVNTNGAIASGNAGVLKGGTVFTEVRPTADGTFIKKASTAGANLTALDTATKDAIKGLSVNGKVITYTKGDGTTGTITTQDTNTTYAAMSADELSTGTATTSRTMTAKVVGDYVKSKTDDKIKALSLDGNVLTYTKGNDSTGTITLPPSGGGSTPYIGINSATGGANEDGSGAAGENAIAIGVGARTGLLSDGLAIGSNSQANGKSSVAIGLDAQAIGLEGVAVGRRSRAYGTDSVAIGQGATVTETTSNSVAIGAGSSAHTSNVVSFGHMYGDSYAIEGGGHQDELYRRLINVAAGTGTHDVSTVEQTGSALELTGSTLKLKSIVGDLSQVDLSALAGQTYSAGNHISIGNDNSIAAVVDGTVSSGNTGLVNGGQVYDALQTIRPNVYIAGNGIVINGDDNSVSVKNVVMYDSDAQDTATLNGTRGTKLTNLKAATLGQTSTDAVIGNQLWTTNKNIEGVRNSVNINTTNIASLNTSMTNALESVTSIGTLVDTIDGLKADKSLNNLDDAGKQVIATAAANAVQEYMANNNKVVPMNKVVMNSVVPDDWSSIDDELALKADKDDVYSKSETDTMLDTKADVSYVDDQLSTKANADEVYMKDEVDTMLGTKADVDSVYTKDEANALLDVKADKSELDAKVDKTDLEAKAEVDASNIDVDKWSEKLGTGEIAEGNTGLVNGGAVFEAMKSVSRNDIIKAGTESIEIGSDAKYDGLDSVSIAKSDGSGRVLRGVLVDPADETSAANVGYVNAVADGITAGINQGFAKLDSKINKTGAGAAALANLHPLNDDGDTKWNVAAGFGRYHGESAGALGVFYKPSDRVAVNISSTVGNSDTMFGAGVTFAVDKPMANGLSKVEMAKTINVQANEIQQLKLARQEDRNQIAQQGEHIAQLEAMVKELAKK